MDMSAYQKAYEEILSVAPLTRTADKFDFDHVSLDMCK